MINNKTSHILNTSSNLLGFCLVVLTSLKISKYSEVTLIDEVTGVACVLLMASGFLSFLSIRTTKEKFATRYEKFADTIFIIAMSFVFIITFMIAFTVIF